MKKVFIVRQSAVLPSDYSRPKEWREVIFFKWAKSRYADVGFLISGFDHYALEQRQEVHFDSDEGVLVFHTPGYKSTTSIFRVFDAWIFALKVFSYSLTQMKRTDVVVVSIPTPESAFCLSLARLVKRFTLILDIRDNWPDNFNGRGLLKKAFSLYVLGLNQLSFSVADKIIWMSDGLCKNHAQKGLLKGSHATQATIPVPLPLSPTTSSGDEEFDYLFEKPALCFFGTLNAQFDLGVLKSFIDSSPSSADFNYVIAGSGSQLSELKTKFLGYSNVFFLGHIPFEVTQSISKRASGFFLYYQNPATFENHITNKLRELAEHKKPILHNLNSSEFTVGQVSYQIGCSCYEYSFEQALVAIQSGEYNEMFGIQSLEKLSYDLSWDALRIRFLNMIS